MGAPSLRRDGRHQPQPSISPLPWLVRSRSGTSVITVAENKTPSSSSSQRFRSKSNTRSRIHVNTEHTEPAVKDVQSTGFGRVLRRDNPGNSSANGVKSATSSPSAWALSPGRKSPCVVAQEQSIPGGAKVKSGGSRTGGVLRFFRQKKVSLAHQEEYHQLRVLYNRMLQWRFVNARAEAAMAATKKNVEVKMLRVWRSVYRVGSDLMEYRIEARKLKNEIKLYQILIPQMSLLKEWAELERKNLEAVGRLSRKLEANLLSLPLAKDVKANVESLADAVIAAMEVLESVGKTTAKFYSQAEIMLYLVTELASMLEQQDECLAKLEKIVQLLSSSTAEEKSLRAHMIQVMVDKRKVLAWPSSFYTTDL